MSTTTLLDKMRKAGSLQSTTLDKSEFFADRDIISTEIPIINVAFSGNLDGGLSTGITVFAGDSKTFKTLLGLYCIKAYMNAYEDSVCLFYDSEFGSTLEYMEKIGIPMNRVEHIGLENVGQLKSDLVKRLDVIERGEKVFIFVDSLGNLASRKEIEDAREEKTVADMTRAKDIKSLFRIITPMINMRDIPCVIVNHTYDTMELYSKPVVSGGKGIMYSANQVFIISKAQIKDKDNDIVGYKFTITIDKSRYVKEKSKLSFSALYETGLDVHSGLFDLAMEAGIVKEVSKGWYSSDGKNKVRKSEIEADNAFFDEILADDDFKSFVNNKYKS